MFMTLTEVFSTDLNSDENSSIMPAIMSSNCSASALLSQKRSAASVTDAECFNMSLGAGPLWWSDAPGENRGSPGEQPVPSTSPPLRLTFRATPGAGSPPRTPASSQPWDAVLRGDTLYVTPPPHLGEGSREAFVALLEAAEDQLRCKHVIVVFPADRGDKANLVRTFKFLGFSMLSPTHSLVPPQLAPGNVCMLYNVEE
ncbi:LOW QUALITY PROTEIN: ornithine decarboxylase antizyme 2 [Euwallacea fornicatus]|uniref:LOW QUALITY PROTEIN: ornithine decarboxylase antizyme 2 n=1 Tax=Euwallacea fornicatus TaxID=995702 RepID=UPI00338DCFAD